MQGHGLLLFGLNVSKLFRRIQEVIGVCFGVEGAVIGLLDVILIALLVGKLDGVLFGTEIEMCALHSVGGGLPSHQRVLPPVAFREYVPVHPPMV